MEKDKSYTGKEVSVMEKKNIDWGSLGFAYMPTDKR